MMEIVANGFGVLSTLCFIASFQIKSNKALYGFQAAGTFFYGMQFLLLGATGGVVNMLMQVARNLLLLKKNSWSWLSSVWFPILVCVPSFIVMVLTWNSPLDLLPFIAYAGVTFAYWTNNAKTIRVSELGCACPSWLVYDFATGAYGGILTEFVIAGSVIASIIRFGWKGLDDPDFAK